MTWNRLRNNWRRTCIGFRKIVSRKRKSCAQRLEPGNGACHPEPQTAKDLTVGRNLNLCRQRQFEKSLAFARDDSSISAPSLGNRLGGLRCGLTALGQIRIEETEHMRMIDDADAFSFL